MKVIRNITFDDIKKTLSEFGLTDDRKAEVIVVSHDIYKDIKDIYNKDVATLRGPKDERLFPILNMQFEHGKSPKMFFDGVLLLSSFDLADNELIVA